MTEKKPENGESPADPEIDQTLMFSDHKTEPNLPLSDAAASDVPDLPIELTMEVGGASDHLQDPSSASDPNLTIGDAVLPTMAATFELPVPTSKGTQRSIAATWDATSILESPDIRQTIDPRHFDELEDREGLFSLSDELRPDNERAQHVDRRKITESVLTVPARHISGMATEIQADPTDIPADYEVVKVLGEGGMGTVFLARQTALDRMVALKVVKPQPGDQPKQHADGNKIDQAAKNRRDQFLAEAVVTGDLDHPNIVPIHDLAVAGEGTLFYVMKKVDGIPWSRVIRMKSQDENLEIFLKICDAIAFAHSRGIVHRDIKPENVMLGDFGVVLLMDWGLAVPNETYAKRGTIYQTSSLGGSPAYMAPEMVLGPINVIGPASDIYLLGATLFEIVVGRPPHAGKNVSECIRSVTKNIFIEAPQSKLGELLDIAKKAMATVPMERYKTVAELQDAIRQYRSHAESIMLTVRAEEDLELARNSKAYHDHARSVFGFDEAFKLWDGNVRAQQGLNVARLAYAETAHGKEDFDLGLSLLDRSDPEHTPLIAKLQADKKERESRIRRLAWMKRTAVGLIAFILIGGGAALFQISKDRDRARVAEREATKNRAIAVAKAAEAIEQRSFAEEKTIEAEKNLMLANDNEKTALANAREAEQQRSIAENQKMLAENQRMLAESQKMLADQKADEAERERRNAEYEAYIAQIGLAKARIDQNEFDDARRILIELKNKLGENESLSWELRWLWHQANQAEKSESLDNAANGVSLSQQKTRALVTVDDGTLQLFRLNALQGLEKDVAAPLTGISNATASAMAPDETQLAFADQMGMIHLWDIETGKSVGQLNGHTAEVTALVFLDGSKLISASRDRSLRLWDLETKAELASCWHIGPVVDVACNRKGELIQVAAAVANDRSGRVVVWEYHPRKRPHEFLRQSDFLEHQAPVLGVAISPSGNLVASGDRSGKILVWNPDEVPATDYRDAVSRAITQWKSGPQADQLLNADAKARELFDRSEFRPLRLVSFNQPHSVHAHRDAIESLRFNIQGTELLSASADYTMKVWDVDSGMLKQTIRGHGGWVKGAEFSGQDDRGIVSVSNDKTIRYWRLAGIQDPPPYQVTAVGPDQKNPHRDEIWSARFDKKGKRIVTASRDHTAAVLEIDPQSLRFVPIASLAEDKPHTLIEGTSFVALSMVADLTHRRLFVGSADAFVRIWNLDAGTEMASIPGTGLNTMMAISPDGNLLVTGSSSADAQAMIWDVAPKSLNAVNLLHKLQGHQATVTAVAISKDSEMVFTADRNGVGILWNARTGERMGEPFLHHAGTRINAAAFHPNGQDLLLAGDNQLVSWVRLSDRSTLKTFLHKGFVTKLDVSADGSSFATVSEFTAESVTSSSLTIWNFESDEGTIIQSARKDAKGSTQSKRSDASSANSDGRILSVHFDASGGIIACSADDLAGRVTTWQPVRKNEYAVKLAVKLPAILPGCAEAIVTGANRMLSLNGDAAFLWDLGSMTHLRSYRTHGGITEANFSADGELVISASRSIRIWNIATARSIHKIEEPHIGKVNGVEFSPLENDFRFASAGDDGVVKLWQWDPITQQSQTLRSFAVEEARRAAINRVRFSPDGRRLLAVDAAGVARLWKTDSDEPPQAFFDDQAKTSFLCGAFSKDGLWIAVGCQDRQARVWQIQDNVPENRTPLIFLRGHADQIEDIHFLGNGREPLRILTGSRDKSARIWDPRMGSGTGQGREVLALQRHTLGVTAVDATSDGSLMLTAGRDGSVILWPATANTGPN